MSTRGVQGGGEAPHFGRKEPSKEERGIPRPSSLGAAQREWDSKATPLQASDAPKVHAAALGHLLNKYETATDKTEAKADIEAYLYQHQANMQDSVVQRQIGFARQTAPQEIQGLLDQAEAGTFALPRPRYQPRFPEGGFWDKFKQVKEAYGAFAAIKSALSELFGGSPRELPPYDQAKREEWDGLGGSSLTTRLNFLAELREFDAEKGVGNGQSPLQFDVKENIRREVAPLMDFQTASAPPTELCKQLAKVQTALQAFSGDVLRDVKERLESKGREIEGAFETKAREAFNQAKERVVQEQKQHLVGIESRIASMKSEQQTNERLIHEIETREQELASQRETIDASQQLSEAEIQIYWEKKAALLEQKQLVDEAIDNLRQGEVVSTTMGSEAISDWKQKRQALDRQLEELEETFLMPKVFAKQRELLTGQPEKLAHLEQTLENKNYVTLEVARLRQRSVELGEKVIAKQAEKRSVESKMTAESSRRAQENALEYIRAYMRAQTEVPSAEALEAVLTPLLTRANPGFTPMDITRLIRVARAS